LAGSRCPHAVPAQFVADMAPVEVHNWYKHCLTPVFWLYWPKAFQIKEFVVKLLFIISTDDGETAYNAVRLANIAVKKCDDVSIFMIGKGVLFEQNSNEQFNVMEQLQQFDGDFYV
jgi:uncharacterized protein involved in oxidation of intracellular sulfur